MRIGIITGEFPPMQGGVGAYTRSLSEALSELGHELHILTTGNDESPQTARRNGFVVHRVVPKWNASCIRRVHRWLASVSPDVVSLQYEPAAYGLRAWVTAIPRLLRLRPPLITTFHDLLPPYLFPKAGTLRQWSVWQMAHHAEGCIVTNAEDRQTLKRVLGPRQPETRLIPIGSNIRACRPPDYDRRVVRDRYGIDREALVVAYFGFLNRTKGVDTLLHAVAHLVAKPHSVHLLLIGGRTGTSDAANTKYAAEVDATIEALDLAEHVHRTGYVTDEEVSAALLASDVCALPYADGANLRRGTLHAALAHGCPTVTTTPRVPAEGLANEDTVLLVPPDSPVHLADAISRLSGDPQLRKALSAAAKRLATRFTWSSIAREVVAFCQALLSRVGAGT